jgi:hypothetical protein
MFLLDETTIGEVFSRWYGRPTSHVKPFATSLRKSSV